MFNVCATYKFAFKLFLKIRATFSLEYCSYLRVPLVGHTPVNVLRVSEKWYTKWTER